MEELVPTLRSSKVLIVGKGTGWEQSFPYLASQDWNIWTIVQSYALLGSSPRTDLVFELHQPVAWRRKKVPIQRINMQYSNPPKLMVTQRHPGFTNNSFLLPIEEIQNLELPLVNSFAWMIAYAIYRGATEISLRGINMSYAQEAKTERDGLMYILGYLKASEVLVDEGRSSGLARSATWNNPY